MTVKLNAGLATSILVSSGLAPVALTAQPAQALDICIAGEPISITVGTEIIDPNFPADDFVAVLLKISNIEKTQRRWLYVTSFHRNAIDVVKLSL